MRVSAASLSAVEPTTPLPAAQITDQSSPRPLDESLEVGVEHRDRGIVILHGTGVL